MKLTTFLIIFSITSMVSCSEGVLLPLSGPCTATLVTTEYGNEYDKDNLALACMFDDDRVYDINAPTKIIQKFESGIYTSGATILDIGPDATIDTATNTIMTDAEIKVIKTGDEHVKITTSGDRTFLMVRVIANDGETSASEERLSDSLFGTYGDPVTLKSQFHDCSHGLYNVMMTENRTSTDGIKADITNGATTVTVNINTSQGDTIMRNAISDELFNQFGVSASNLANHLLYCLPPGTMSGIAYAYVNSWLSVYSDRWCEYLSTQMHEIGHNIGLAHSNEQGTYKDQSCMMGYSYSSDNGPLMCFNAAKMWQLQWYIEKQIIVTQDGPNNTYRGEIAGYTEDISSPTTPAMLIKLDIAETNTDFYVFFNRKIGFNSGTVEGGNQVLVTRYTGTGYAESELVAKLSTADTFTTPDGVGRVTVISIGDRAFVEATFNTLAPSISPSPTYSPSTQDISVKYYVAQSWNNLPIDGLESLEPYSSDTVATIDFPSTSGNFATSGRDDDVAALFQGYVNFEVLGLYELCITSDDGSKLYIDSEELMINNDGLHGMVQKCASKTLVGVHKVDVEFFERGGGAGLIVEWKQPGDSSRSVIPAYAWVIPPPTIGPTKLPSILPTFEASDIPSSSPSALPTFEASDIPSSSPSALPTFEASDIPSSSPSALPTFEASSLPTVAPSLLPTTSPIVAPSILPTTSPTVACFDSGFSIAYSENSDASIPCDFVSDFSSCLCNDPDVSSHCPSTCDSCSVYGCVDSTATFYSPLGAKVNCGMLGFADPSDLETYCEIGLVRNTCRETCGVCN